MVRQGNEAPAPRCPPRSEIILALISPVCNAKSRGRIAYLSLKHIDFCAVVSHSVVSDSL